MEFSLPPLKFGHIVASRIWSGPMAWPTEVNKQSPSLHPYLQHGWRRAKFLFLAGEGGATKTEEVNDWKKVQYSFYCRFSEQMIVVSLCNNSLEPEIHRKGKLKRATAHFSSRASCVHYYWRFTPSSKKKSIHEVRTQGTSPVFCIALVEHCRLMQLSKGVICVAGALMRKRAE